MRERFVQVKVCVPTLCCRLRNYSTYCNSLLVARTILFGQAILCWWQGLFFLDSSVAGIYILRGRVFLLYSFPPSHGMCSPCARPRGSRDPWVPHGPLVGRPIGCYRALAPLRRLFWGGGGPGPPPPPQAHWAWPGPHCAPWAPLPLNFWRILDICFLIRFSLVPNEL